MTKSAAHIYCLIFLFAFHQFAEAKSGAAASRTEETFSLQRNVRTDEKEKFAISEMTRIVAEIVNTSFPELKNASVKIKTFRSRSDFFRSRFSFARFLTFRKLHFLIFVNPQVFEKDAPPAGIRAIIAHELAHVAYYRRRKRFELFGLMSLQSKSFTARFERGADLQAIKRGYGAGLKQYREWLYANIPAAKVARKERDYFSPEEIDLIMNAIKTKPFSIEFWIKNVPPGAAQIQIDIASGMSFDQGKRRSRGW